MKSRVILFLLGHLLSVNCFSYLYTEEAFLERDHSLCLGDCVLLDGSYQCVYDWHGHVAPCVTSGVKTKRYRTIDNKICYSNCGHFGEDYEWCVTNDGDVINWGKCSRNSETKAKVTYQTDDEFLTCSDECTQRSSQDLRTWCNTVKNWQYCDRNKTVILFSRYTVDNKKCGSPCALYEDEPFCYDVEGNWARCFLGPDNSDAMSLQSRDWEQNWRKGEYTKHGYKLSDRIRKRGLKFSHPVDVEAVARQRESVYPTVTVRHVDPNDMITIDRDPTIQYCVFDTVNPFNNEQLALPVVYRAIVTDNTLRRAGERDTYWPVEITRNFDRMNPILTGDKKDEKGHILASRLGGPTAVHNIFPQARCHNAGKLSRWYYLESDIFKFISGHSDRYAEYTAVLSYDLKSTTPYRPTAVGLTVRLYTGRHQACDADAVPLANRVNSLANMYYTNDPNFSCMIEGEEIEDHF